MDVADAVYAVSPRRGERATPSDRDIARTRALIRRFLEELPADLCVEEMRREIGQRDD